MSFAATTENTAKARKILENKIAQGQASALALIERIQTDVPEDAIVRSSALAFKWNGSVKVGFGGGEFAIHQHALSQMASRAGIPGSYLGDLANGPDEWQRALAAEILNKHFHEGAAGERYLARSVRGQVRGFLSSCYRRLDSRPLVETFAQECQKVGAVPVDGTFSDTRVALKALIPQVYEPVPGEVMAFGIEWHNSDYGQGAHAIRAFILRVACLNGATMANAMAQVHIGGRLTDDIEFSRRTYELDTKASISALRDVVRGTLSAPKIEALCLGIKSAQEAKIDWKGVRGKVGARLLKGELEKVRDAFEGPDVQNLPAGDTTWRASNALSWIAHQAESPDRKLTLERLAGEIVDGRKDSAAVVDATVE